VTSFAGGLEGRVTRLTGDTTAVGQRFTVAGTEVARFAEVFLQRLGDIPGRIFAAIHEDNGGEPGLLVAKSEAKFANSLTSELPDYGIFNFADADFSADGLGAGNYWLVLFGDSDYIANADSRNHVAWARQTNGAAGPSAVTDGVFKDTNSDSVPDSFWVVNAGIQHFFKVIGEN
jgi:hypothetical protein